MASADSGRSPRIAPPPNEISRTWALPAVSTGLPAIASDVGGASPTQSRIAPMNRVRPPVAPPVSTRSTRPHANRPSLKGIDQNCPGRRWVVVFGTSGYIDVIGSHPTVVGLLCRALARFRLTLHAASGGQSDGGQQRDGRGVRGGSEVRRVQPDGGDDPEVRQRRLRRGVAAVRRAPVEAGDAEDGRVIRADDREEPEV